VPAIAEGLASTKSRGSWPVVEWIRFFKTSAIAFVDDVDDGGGGRAQIDAERLGEPWCGRQLLLAARSMARSSPPSSDCLSR